MEDNGSVSEGTSSEGTITWKDIEKAQIKIMEEGFRLRYRKDSKFIREYAGYVSRLRQEENPDEYVRNVAVMLFPDDEAYNIKITRYRKWYANKKNLLKSVEHLYKLYYELSKEERPMVTNEIENAIEEAIKAESIYPEGTK
ncbi:uncharacterized protein OCT59_028499 [Rhizophagus irregularis]|uniref:Uncharacterized protein n=2 Tax=Rhizophagus irregularis TaxID=588596 RepID=A0A015JH48_RHIIW|nr:hypothetical protein RirG_101510 [Rhizophagus irregularis DAOM 197198w]EXX68833.1 hypothetical protein RirG_101520 [Rhizophagus irregularis DAOM 197198w]UZO08241.1 hypothetical protein OCT59_028499 [Rhizophagus irregularis]GBC52964.2 hypothetical protein GLOIN_2v1875369 [Rhizophagus irregularis DAOM 181602=DAOM 197198]CAG8685922.1 15688_t:CDS:1 [Rhizophagus irregularis]